PTHLGASHRPFGRATRRRPLRPRRGRDRREATGRVDHDWRDLYRLGRLAAHPYDLRDFKKISWLARHHGSRAADGPDPALDCRPNVYERREFLCPEAGSSAIISRMRNIRLILSYDGSRFFGWQKTSTGPSI